MSRENKTKPTAMPVDDFLSTVSEQRATESRQLIEIMQEITGEPAVMWGPSIIGFGRQHYKSEAGREGDMGLLGFSPRKASLTVYFYEGFNHHGARLEKLGKHRTSVGCLYINKLSDVKLDVLTQMLQRSYDLATKPKKQLVSVDEYIVSVPLAARAKLDELRKVVHEMFPEGNEVVSYGVIGYKVGDKRARVFISGWKDHVAVYPVPKNPDLHVRLKKYIRGKGTLWFPLDAPLPRVLLRDVVADLSGA